MRRGYVDGTFGQVHYLEAGAQHADAAPPLVCLHATAYSSRSLEKLVVTLGKGRRVLAIDTPGYGGSDGPDEQVEIGDYAEALADAIARLSPDGPVDVFGYHTGATIAFEAAATRAGLIGRIVALGIPLFCGDDHATWRERLVERHVLGGDLAQFAERWAYLVGNRPAGMTLEAGFRNFVDELRAWPNGWWAHEALFRHDLTATLANVPNPVLVINPDSPLAPMSREAARLLPRATLVERADLSGAVLEQHVADLANLIEGFLEPIPVEVRRVAITR